MLKPLFFIFCGYLIGSIPTGYLLARKFAGINIQEYGSGNIGATNLNRVLGKKFAILTVLGDGLKAFLYTLFLKDYLNLQEGKFNPLVLLTLCLSALAILLGNCFSAFLHFKAGKGGVTTYGVFLALAPGSTLISIIIYLGLLYRVKISGLGTLISVLSLPFMLLFLLPPTEVKGYLVVLSLCFVIIVWLRHIPNIKQLRQRWKEQESAADKKQ